jgi:hypothetical protein
MALWPGRALVPSGAKTGRKVMSSTYGFVYSGFVGVGLGIFRVTDSQLVGCDLGGVIYQGTFIKDEATGEMVLSVDQTVPPGVFLVQGTSPLDMTHTRKILGRLPATFDDGKPMELHTDIGSVTLMIRRIPDEWAPYADGVNMQITPMTPRHS